MAQLPDEIIASLQDSIACRELQIRQLSALLAPSLPNASTLIVHGGEATGKTMTMESILEAIGTPFAYVRSRECITTRHLLERTVSTTNQALQAQQDGERVDQAGGRCESISAFVVELQALLGRKGKFILVFDGIDRQREAAPALLPAIARLGEIIPNLTTILIVTVPHPHLLHRPGIPHIHFQPYTRAETLSILSKSPMTIHDSRSSSPSPNSQISTSDEDSEWLWARFVAAIWDSLGQTAARDVVSFRQVCSRLWKPFIQPILDGHYGAREFSKLTVRNKSLLQSEAALADSIVPIAPTAPNIKTTQGYPSTISCTESSLTAISNTASSYTLPYYPSYLLIAAYLASHNMPKHDVTLFSKSSLSKRRKRGGGTALTPHRVSKHRKVLRKLLGPQLFPLERLLAIFHSIVPQTFATGGADIMCQFATLVGLKLVVKSGGGGDVLEGGAKWRVNVGFEFVRELARGVGFDVERYLIE